MADANTFPNIRYPTTNPDTDFNASRNSHINVTEQAITVREAFAKVENTRNGVSSGALLDKFDVERRSRALVIENVPTNLTYMSLAGFFNRREFGTLKGPVLTELSSMGKVYVSFTDSREAKKAIEKVHLLRPEWHVFPLTAREYVQHSEPSLLSQTSDYEGQLLITVYYNSRNSNLNQQTVARSLEMLAMTFGDIKMFTLVPTRQENICQFHLEFFNTRDAENVMVTLNKTSVDVNHSFSPTH
ncbi:hypothetical protein EYZ11_009953 [Aspergillus tanneri]|uniref:RRM domain-containing protein n=1 Tax=Aspergillus tanneri TaxID=1220188 RepID=A0A4S3JBY7_9EURO|nr:hypothetical protein EYZ11_009953 [Aspergillus tanneri]